MVYEKDQSEYPIYLHCFGGGVASVTHVTQCMDIVEPTIYGNFHDSRFRIPDMCLINDFLIKTGEGLPNLILLIPKNSEKCG